MLNELSRYKRCVSIDIVQIKSVWQYRFYQLVKIKGKLSWLPINLIIITRTSTWQWNINRYNQSKSRTRTIYILYKCRNYAVYHSHYWMVFNLFSEMPSILNMVWNNRPACHALKNLLKSLMLLFAVQGKITFCIYICHFF